MERVREGEATKKTGGMDKWEGMRQNPSTTYAQRFHHSHVSLREPIARRPKRPSEPLLEPNSEK